MAKLSRMAGGVQPLMRSGLKYGAEFAGRVRRYAPGVVVLLYHRVGAGTPTEVDLPRALFAAQMRDLAQRGDVVSLDAAVDVLGAGDSVDRGDTGEPGLLGDRGVVVTFDDGTADLVGVALPVLVEYGIPATVFVATDFVERQEPFPEDGTPVSWKGLDEAISTGLVTVGSHTHTHRLLDRVDARTAADELDRSIDLIGDRLGVRTRHFAYPKALLGAPGPEAEVRSRFVSASVAGTRANLAGSTDLHRLARSPIQVADGMRWFREKAGGGMRLEDTARRAANRVRYRGASR